MVWHGKEWAILFCVLLLSGCATSNIQKVSLDPMERPLRVILVETLNSADLAELRNVFAPDLSEVSDEANKLVESGMAEAETGAMIEMQNALTNVGAALTSAHFNPLVTAPSSVAG